MSQWFRNERRKVDRVRPAPDTPLGIQLVMPGEGFLMGEVHDISAAGTAVSFPLSQCPVLDCGDSIQLLLEVKHPERAIRIKASVVEVTDQNQKKFCRLKMSIPDEFLAGLHPSIMSCLNRRAGVRVAMHKIEVALKWPAGSGVGQLINLSVTGCCVGLDPEVFERIESFASVTLTFQLHGEDAPVEIQGRIVNHQQSDGVMLCGVEFANSLFGGANNQAEVISSFLTEQ